MTGIIALLRFETGLDLLETFESLWPVVDGASTVTTAGKVLTLPVGVVLEQ